MLKKILGVYSAERPHWVGNAFPVRNLFSYGSHGAQLSPFLLFGHSGPVRFEPAAQQRGVGEHPHRGFETVTIVYDGEVEHRDSTGNGGIIGKGDVQWMTAAGGIIHEEFHSPGYAERGGPFEMVQLWVNLPKKDKMAAAGYQGITDAQIPAVALPDDAGILRVIAGEYDGHRGPASTFSPINVWDVRLAAGKTIALPQPEGWTTLVVVLAGTVQLNGETVLQAAQMATLSTAGSDVTIEASGDAKLLLLAGEPIDEPVVGYGPFVMNSQQEIIQAIADFNGGKFGQMH